MVGKTESGAALSAQCADPEEAVRFIRETGVDALAVAIGNAHGVYEGTPELRFDVLERMQGRCGQTTFVLHGGTGITASCFRRAIALGIAQVPQCTQEEMNTAIAAARAAFPAWKNTPVRKRAAIMRKLYSLIERDMEELTRLVATENGKCWSEAAGDVGKALEMTELACSAPSLLMGESLMDTSAGYDTTLYREPIGVFAGIAPWNFPAMIPVGWMAPLSIVCGNTFVLKPAPTTPLTCLKIAALYRDAGVPDGVFNIVPCGTEVASTLLTHPDVRGVTFVGSTNTGRHVYARQPPTASACSACAKPRTMRWCWRTHPLAARRRAS